MPDLLPCAICQRPATPEAPELHRPLVPTCFLDSGVFDIDPLGTAGASVALCAECAEVLEAPMLLGEDVQEFARALEMYRKLHPSAEPRDDRAARVRLWHRALHLGMRALVGELSVPAPVVPPRPEPDQLRLFSSKAARLAKVEAALAEGDFEGARVHAEEVVRRFDLPEARYLVARLPAVAAQVAELRSDLEALDALAMHPDRLLETPRVTVSLASAFARGLHRKVAEAGAPGGMAGGKLTGWHWLRAGDRVRAQACLEAAVASQCAPAEALTLLGNIAFERGDVGHARELYRRALCCDPLAVPVERISDEAVQQAVDEAEELELAPSAEWAPIVGWVSGLFALPDEPQGVNGCREFHRALLEARRARGSGNAEERRAMQQLAPKLFERLRDAGRI